MFWLCQQKNRQKFGGFFSLQAVIIRGRSARRLGFLRLSCVSFRLYRRDAMHMVRKSAFVVVTMQR